MQNISLLLLVTVFTSMVGYAPSSNAIPASAFIKSSQLSQKEFEHLIDSTSTNYNFDGILALNNCSGSLIRFETSLPNQKALALTNGHCVSYNGGFIPPNGFVANEPSTRSFAFLNPQGQTNSAARAKATRLVYGTMTGTDIGIYELEYTYEQIEQKFNAHALTLSSDRSSVSADIQILSGYWKRGYECSIDKFVYQIREDAYSFTDSIRYTTACNTVHGTSGSPIISKSTGKVVGINNTGNDSGGRCTMNNPCEVSATGEIYVEQGRNYGQQTYQIYSCLNANSEIDLAVPGCKLLH